MGALFGTSLDTRSAQFAPLTDDTLILRQRIELLLDTQPGVYWSAPDCGASLSQYILRGMTDAQFSSIPTMVKQALMRDEGIANVVVNASQTFTGGGSAAVRLDIAVYAKGQEGAPYQFTAVASADAVNVIVRGST